MAFVARAVLRERRAGRSRERPFPIMLKVNRIPVLTLGLCLGCCLLMLLPAQVQALLFFDSLRLQQGQVLGLVSGHWLHADGQHLLWNLAALAVLGTLLETRSRSLLWLSLGLGTLGVDLLLLTGTGAPQRYCGLSGVLNTLLAVVVYLLWRERRQPLILGIGLVAVIKIALEIHSGQAVFTDISWPPYAPAHLAGLLAAIPLLAWCHWAPAYPIHKRSRHGHLVTGK